MDPEGFAEEAAAIQSMGFPAYKMRPALATNVHLDEVDGLAVDEVDEAFANIYSSTMSVQNLFGGIDRRIVAVIVGCLAMFLAATLDFAQYASFLYLIGSVFVPLISVAATDFFMISKQRWDVSDTAPFRLAPILAWACGFVVYQLIYPGDLPRWSAWWSGIAEAIGFQAPSWLGSSVGAIVISGVAMLIFGSLAQAFGRHREG